MRREAAEAGPVMFRYAWNVAEDLESRLREHLATRADVIAAYLFGSRARDEATATSDVDIAIWLRAKPTGLNDAPLELADELAQAVGLPVDVVVLNGAPSDLVHRVLRDGVLLLETDRSARIAFEVRARSDYFDLMPVRNAYRYPRRPQRV